MLRSIRFQCVWRWDFNQASLCIHMQLTTRKISPDLHNTRLAPGLPKHNDRVSRGMSLYTQNLDDTRNRDSTSQYLCSTLDNTTGIKTLPSETEAEEYFPADFGLISANQQRFLAASRDRPHTEQPSRRSVGEVTTRLQYSFRQLRACCAIRHYVASTGTLSRPRRLTKITNSFLQHVHTGQHSWSVCNNSRNSLSLGTASCQKCRPDVQGSIAV